MLQMQMEDNPAVYHNKMQAVHAAQVVALRDHPEISNLKIVCTDADK